MEQARQIQAFLEAVAPFEMVSVGSAGAEQLAFVIHGSVASSPRERHRQVVPIRGCVTQTYYIQQQDLLRWALAEEDTGGSKWVVLHAWIESRNRWVCRIVFRTLKQPRRGHQLKHLHGRRMSISYSVGIEDQIVAVKEEGNGHLWWVFYVEGPDRNLVHLVSLRVETPVDL